jgi:ubiquinone/menaquinone biosynthesis C-methylase UbiE
MPMNRAHRALCKSRRWSRRVEGELLPWVLRGVDLGDNVLEIGPGFGVTTAVLANKVDTITAVEVDGTTVDYLRNRFGDSIRIVHGDGASMPLPNNDFSAAVCFTMLHHVPSPVLQDELFAEAFRVLRPGGVFAGCDSLLNLRFRLLHLGDTMVVVDPRELPDRLRRVGFEAVEIRVGGRSFRFRARKP